MSKRIPTALGLILLILAIWLLFSHNNVIEHLIERLEHLGYDLQLRTTTIPKQLKKNLPIAIVDIDDYSLKEEGRWPWSRDKVARLVDRIHEQNAAVVVFDILFAEKEVNVVQTILNTLSKKQQLPPAFVNILTENQKLFDVDSIFAQSLAQSTSVLAITFMPRLHTENSLPPPILKLTPEQKNELNLIDQIGYIGNIPILQQAAKATGFINIFPDEDGIIRRAPLLLAYQDKVYPSLALQAVMSFLNESIELYTPSYAETHKLEGIKLGHRLIPTDESALVFIPYIGRSFTFPYYSATHVLKGKIPKDALLGKIVFIGTSATGTGDIKPTAIDIVFPGVEIQASIALGLLKNNFTYKPAWTYGEHVIVTILFGLIAAFAFPYFGPRLLSIIILTFPPLMLFIHDAVWESTGLLLSFLIPTLLVVAISLVNILYGYLFETRRREHLKQMFGQYVPAKHIDAMIKTKSSFGLRGDDREMTVLFADIRNFTSISENLTASELVELLNTYLTPMTEIIFKNYGTIDKYVGDLIMAFWGAPLKDKNHARNALTSALAMKKKLSEFHQHKESAVLKDLHIGIGLNSGVMSVGDMGSKYRRNYTVLGDEVNLASRVEGLTKFYGVTIIVTESTKGSQQKFVFRTLDKVRVKGKHKGIIIYELICTIEELTLSLKQELDKYHHALEDYFAQRFQQAKQVLRELSDEHPHKKIYHILLDRIAEYEKNPPPSDWDGIFTHTTK